MRNAFRLCFTCDAWYDPTDPHEAAVHKHPEPQSGPPRDALLRFCSSSGENYSEWIVKTSEGRAWAARKP